MKRVAVRHHGDVHRGRITPSCIRPQTQQARSRSHGPRHLRAADARSWPASEAKVTTAASSTVAQLLYARNGFELRGGFKMMSARLTT
jgi:hypothetical protein